MPHPYPSKGICGCCLGLEGGRHELCWPPPARGPRRVAGGRLSRQFGGATDSKEAVALGIERSFFSDSVIEGNEEMGAVCFGIAPGPIGKLALAMGRKARPSGWGLQGARGLGARGDSPSFFGAAVDVWSDGSKTEATPVRV